MTARFSRTRPAGTKWVVAVLPAFFWPTLTVSAWSIGIVAALLAWAVGQAVQREEDLSRPCRDEPNRCRVLAQAYERGEGRLPDAAAAIELFEAACRAGDSGSCLHLAEMPGTLFSAELPTRLEKACLTGSALSCAQLGSLYREGGGIGAVAVSRDLERAHLFFRKACEGGHGVACFNESLASYRGEGTDRDLPRAAQLALEACTLGVGEGCENMGYQVYFGQGVAQSRRLALWYFQKACDLDAVSGCDSLAELNLFGEWETARPDIASQLWKQGCANREGRGWSCLALGRARANGSGVAKDPTEAQELYEKAKRRLNLFCFHRDGGECLGLALAFAKGLGVARDAGRAADLFGQACRYGDPLACFYLGRAFREGQGVGLDPVEAATHFASACRAGAVQGCVALAKALRDGEGVPPNPRRARRLLRRACRAEYESGCRALAAMAEVSLER